MTLHSPPFPPPHSTRSVAAADPPGPDLLASPSRSQIAAPIPSETPRSPPRCPAARSIAAPHLPPASSRRCPSACPSPVRRRPAIPAPRQTLGDASPHRSTAAFVRSSYGPALPRSAASLRTHEWTVSPQFATRCLAHCRCLRLSLPAAVGNRYPAPRPAGASWPHIIAGTSL